MWIIKTKYVEVCFPEEQFTEMKFIQKLITNH